MKEKNGQKGLEVPLFNELKTQQDVVHELGLLHKKKHLSQGEANEVFRHIGAAIADMPIEDEVDTHIKIFIDATEYDVTLKPSGSILSLVVTKHHTG